MENVLKTVIVDFSSSRIIGGIICDPVPIGTRVSSIPVGETRDVSIEWTGIGHYRLYVDVQTDKDSIDVWIPKSKTSFISSPATSTTAYTTLRVISLQSISIILNFNGYS